MQRLFEGGYHLRYVYARIIVHRVLYNILRRTSQAKCMKHSVSTASTWQWIFSSSLPWQRPFPVLLTVSSLLPLSSPCPWWLCSVYSKMATKRVSASIRCLLLNLLWIPDLEALLHFILKGLVTCKIEGLQLVTANSGHFNMLNVVLLRKLMKCRDLVAPEDIKYWKTWIILFLRPWPPTFPGKWNQNFIVYLIIVASFDQWFSLCHTSHSGGNSIAEWHLSVLPWWRIWGGGYSPASVTAIITVICLLSSRPAMGIDCSPCLLIVHALTGTRWMAVWSQLITRDGGMSLIITSAWMFKDIAPFAFQTLEQVL